MRILIAALACALSCAAYAETSPMRTTYQHSGWTSSSIVSAAQRDLGKTAAQLGLPRSLWCGDAADRWRRKAGLTPVRSRRAIDQTKNARRISYPVPGALMITGRGRSGHHVDVVIAVHSDGTVTTIGGNVAGAVRERIRVARGLFVMPV